MARTLHKGIEMKDEVGCGEVPETCGCLKEGCEYV